MTKSPVARKRIEKLLIRIGFDRIPDLIIATIIALVFQGGLAALLEIFLGLQFIYLAVWLRDSAWNWAKFKLRDRKQLILRAEEILSEYKFPQSDQDDNCAEDYFKRVMAAKSESTRTKLQAARQLGAFDYLVENLKAQEYLRLNYVLEEAIHRFSEPGNT